MFVRKKKFEELEKRVEELEKRFYEAFRTRDVEAPSLTQQGKESEAPTVAQVMDEWLNGKKEGEK